MIKGLNVSDDIIIYCAAGYGEKICLKLIAMGYHVVCFCDNARRNEGISLLGLKVFNYQECQLKYPDAVYVVANSSYSIALEIGLQLEEDDYKKNSSYYLAIELENQGLLLDVRKGISLLFEKKVMILFGNLFLCNLFDQWIHKLIENPNVYICSSENEMDYYKNTYPNAIWIPLERDIAPISNKAPEKKERLLECLYNHAIKSLSRFFLNCMIYCEENDDGTENVIRHFDALIKKVVFLKSSPYSGSTLINSIVDYHPNILYLGFNVWSMDIWYIIKKVLSDGGDWVEAIINIIKNEYFSEKEMEWLEKYQQILEKYICNGKIYSEKDLFVVIHLAYYELLHGSLPQGEVIIYMDIHSNMIMRDTVFSWLEHMGFEIILLEMIRNPLKRLGSSIKFASGINGLFPRGTLNMLYIISGETVDEKEKRYPIIRIRFEDLKIYPKQILEKLCRILEIPWSDTLLETTAGGQTSEYVSNGDKITGFDLKPVYHPYDEYFDAFDKFRLDMIFREKNRAYNYSYVEKTKYPTSWKEEENLFMIPFKFEKYIPFKDETDRQRFRQRMQLLCTQILFLEEHKEIYKEHFQFGPYLTVEDNI